MLQRRLDKYQLRRHLDDVLRTDPELNAFCIDFFPDVYRQFSGSMQRIEKLNILLCVLEPDEILDKLNGYSVVHRERKRRFPRAVLVLLIVGITVLAAGIYARLLHHSSPVAESHSDIPMEKAPTDRTRLPAVSVGVNSGNVIDRSPDAQMHNSVRLPSETLPSCANCDNRIQDSRGAKMENDIRMTP